MDARALEGRPDPNTFGRYYQVRAVALEPRLLSLVPSSRQLVELRSAECTKCLVRNVRVAKMHVPTSLSRVLSFKI